MTAPAARGNGIGFGTVLFIVFLVLKLTEQVDWSWWWIFAPLWIPGVLLVLAVVLGAVARLGEK